MRSLGASLYNVHEGLHDVQANHKKITKAIEDAESEQEIDWTTVIRLAEDLAAGANEIKMEAWRETLKEDRHARV